MQDTGRPLGSPVLGYPTSGSVGEAAARGGLRALGRLLKSYRESVGIESYDGVINVENGVTIESGARVV
jgi:hypothetical protein